MSILIARHQEGITINSLEFATNDKGELFKFETQELANAFLLSVGYKQKEIDESIVFKDESTLTPKETDDEAISTS